MLTKNGRKWIGSYLGTKNVKYTNINGDEVTINNSNITNNLQIVIGTGSTVETEDDYKLESEVSDNVKKVAYNKDEAEENYVIACTAVFTNNTGKSVTIKEIGLQTFYTATGGNYKTLVYRKTIDPVKISAGETKTFTVALL